MKLNIEFEEEEIMELSEFFSALREMMPPPDDHPAKKLMDSVDRQVDEIVAAEG